MSEYRDNNQFELEKIPIIQKEIGKTTYSVSIHFSKTSKETVNDKLLRMMKNDIVNGKY